VLTEEDWTAELRNYSSSRSDSSAKQKRSNPYKVRQECIALTYGETNYLVKEEAVY
jgi:hypothetical protein